MTSPGWKPIESAPKDGTKVLIFEGVDGGEIYAAHWDAEFEYTWDEDREEKDSDYAGHYEGAWTDDAVLSFQYETRMKYEPSHWCPLPPRPDVSDA